MVFKGDFVHHGDHRVCPKARPCVGVRTTNGNEPTCTWRVRRIIRLVHQGHLSPTGTETAVFQRDDISSGVFESPGAQPDRHVPAGAVSPADHRRRNLRFPGPVGTGEVTAARTEESGLRRLHGLAGPQRAEDGAEGGAGRWADRSGGSRRRHRGERGAHHERSGGRFRSAVMALYVGL